MAKKIKRTVFVGISGGVDSSVSAILLKNKGYNVVGVFIRTWTPDFIECSWRDERRDAMRVCASINIPFLECDAEIAYKKKVADYMIEEYEKGNTPNPDVMCNREIKFGIFWNFAKKNGADYIATGHYACIKENSFREVTGGGVPFRGNPRNGVKELRENLFSLERNQDKSKDQSYFLWTLTQGDLEHTLFPIGHLNKKEVRKLALKYKIPVATKKDSQGVCFLGKLDMKDFLKHYIPTEKGNVLNLRGEVIGYHNGVAFFTLGERHGFVITKHKKNDNPLYIIKKNIENNTITVSCKSDLLEEKNINNKKILCNKVNWISIIPKENKIYTGQIRYHGELLFCKVKVLQNKKFQIIFKKNVLADKGQSIVIYDGNVCLGGGIVQ